MDNYAMVFDPEEDPASGRSAELFDPSPFADSQGHQTAAHHINNQATNNG
jgi:hypothetical protein